MRVLFEQMAKEHAVPVEQISNSLGQNRAPIDIAMALPFILLYGFATADLARRIWRRYPPSENGWGPGAVMILFLSLVVASGGTMLGQVWCGIAESIRIGNNHMSYRANRQWWPRHWVELFAGAWILFWVAAAAAARLWDRTLPYPPIESYKRTMVRRNQEGEHRKRQTRGTPVVWLYG